jgi:hypothetical protein
VSYSQSFVPSYSFGGTFQNQELNGHVTLPVARRVYVTSTLAWRSNQPVTPIGVGALDLRSLWYEATVGYALRPWARIEGLYLLEHQMINQPGGLLNRNRLGVQVITSTPLRVR